MRVYASKYLGHGVRVGVSQNVAQRRAVPAGPVVQAPPILRWLLIGCAVTGGIGVVLPPMFAVTLVLFVLMLVAQFRWNAAKRRAAR